MSHYIAGGLMILLLCAATLLGLEAYGVYDAARMVDAALLDGQLKLATDGGVSPEVERLIRRRIEADGGDPGRVQVSGTQPHQPYGELVTVQVVYQHPFRLPGEAGTFRVVRSATTMSGWQP